MEIGLLLLRLVVGLLFVGHGTQKLFGWLGGGGIQGTAGFFSKLGYPRERAMAKLAGAAEAGGGALLVLGFLMPVAAAAIIGVMLNAAISAHRRNGLWVAKGGYEYTLVCATVAAALAFAGAGTYSVDAALGWDLSGVEFGLGALFAGVGAGAFVLGLRRPDAAAVEPATREREPRRAA